MNERVTPTIGLLAALYLLDRGNTAAGRLEEPGSLYGLNLAEIQTRELASFVRAAQQELARRGVRAGWKPPLGPDRPEAGGMPAVRITAGLRIFIGGQELRIRPMAKTVLLLFLRHPEGITLKQLADYRDELSGYYRRLSRRENPEAVERSIGRILDIFSNEVNVNISRVNAAVRALVPDPQPYRICGKAGAPMGIGLHPVQILWERPPGDRTELGKTEKR